MKQIVFTDRKKAELLDMPVAALGEHDVLVNFSMVAKPNHEEKLQQEEQNQLEASRLGAG